MNKEVKDLLEASVCWFGVFVIMLICSIITGIDGIFCFIGMFSLVASPICLVGAIIVFVKNKVENTNTYINMKEKQILKNQEKKKQEEKTKKEILNRKQEALQLEAETLIVQARVEMASTLLDNYSNVDKNYLSKEKRVNKKVEIKNMLVEQLDSLREDLERLNNYNVDNDETKEKIIYNLKIVVGGMIDKLEDAIYYIDEKEL